jgi:hypothetical protein
MIAETANLTTARNVVKEAAAITTVTGPIVIQETVGDVMKAEMSWREQNEVGQGLTNRLSGKPQRMTDLKLRVNGGPR